MAITTNGGAGTALSVSADLAAAISDESGTGVVVFNNSPTLVNPALGTPASGTLTNATGLPVSGITASTSLALGVGSVELGHATDTTLSRSSAGVIAVEGVVVPTISSADNLTNKTLTSPALTTPTISTFTTAGDLVYGTGSGAITRLGIGSSTQVLTVAGGVPTWAAGGSAADDDQPILASQIFG